jgi:hypothetical protein
MAKRTVRPVSEWDAPLDDPQPVPNLEVAPIEVADTGLPDLAKKIAVPTVQAKRLVRNIGPGKVSVGPLVFPAGEVRPVPASWTVEEIGALRVNGLILEN